MGLGEKRIRDKKYKRHLRELNDIYKHHFISPVYEVRYYQHGINRCAIPREKPYIKRCYFSGGAKHSQAPAYHKKLSRRIVRRKWQEKKSQSIYNMDFDDFDLLSLSDNESYGHFKKHYPLWWMVY